MTLRHFLKKLIVIPNAVRDLPRMRADVRQRFLAEFILSEANVLGMTQILIIVSVSGRL